MFITNKKWTELQNRLTNKLKNDEFIKKLIEKKEMTGYHSPSGRITYNKIVGPNNFAQFTDMITAIIPLDIVFEDDQLLVINKLAGMVVHPGHGNYSGTLVNALAYHFENLPLNSSERPGLVHRIDKDTTGLLVVAKTEHAMAYLSKQFADKTSEREYIALVWGNIEEDRN